jgi:membrane protease subunit HflK
LDFADRKLESRELRIGEVYLAKHRKDNERLPIFALSERNGKRKEKAMSKNPMNAPIEVNPKQVASFVTIVLAVLLIVYLVVSSAFTVRAYEQAVVMRFGAYNRTVGPGLHFKLPFIETRMLVDMSDHTFRLPWGGREQSGQLQMDRGDETEALIVTADLYAAVVEWNVMWRVSDPKQYLFSIDQRDTESLINEVARSVMNRAVGDYAADELLTTKRVEVGLAAVEAMREMLARYECGIDIFELQMQKVTPPNSVKPSFDEVIASIQQRDQLVNEARREQNQIIPLAEAKRDQLVREAEGYASRRLAEAEGEVSALKQKLEQYQLAPEATRQRLYLESMERVFESSGPITILDSDLKGMLLNLGTSLSPK